MKIERLKSIEIPIIMFDKTLEQFKGKVLFPDKLKKANEILSKTELPNKTSRSTTAPHHTNPQ
jgi:hypothetical protein